MSTTSLLLSIRPRYAEKIFAGTKTVELRRNTPPVRPIDTVLIYVTSPVKALAGIVRVDRVVVQSPRTLWGLVRDKAGITLEEFWAYYSGATSGYGIFIRAVTRFPKPISLVALKKCWSGFNPPQGYCYLSSEQIEWVYQFAIGINQRPLIGQHLAGFAGA